jgi:hypothetical protein
MKSSFRTFFAMVCAVEDVPLDAFEKIRAQMIRGAKTQTFPGMGDADSDLLSVGLESAVARLMEMGRTQIQRGVGRLKRPRRAIP